MWCCCQAPITGPGSRVGGIARPDTAGGIVVSSNTISGHCTSRRLVARSLAQALRTVARGTVSSARDMLQAPRKVSRVCFDMMQRAAKRNGGIVKSSARTHTTRRAILRSAVAVAVAGAATAHWKPKLGIYCRYSPANIAFAGQEGFTCLQLTASGPISPDATDEQLAEVKRSLVARGLTLVALNGGGNHLDPAAQQRFVKIIELAGRLGVSFIGGSSGAIPGRSLDEQVQAIVKAYETQYFPSCEKHKVRILWEPYVNPANIATTPCHSQPCSARSTTRRTSASRWTRRISPGR